ncbi:MAG: transposase [Chloroflexi bacterium]|nr:transposase [Chloroflexota bacterium]
MLTPSTPDRLRIAFDAGRLVEHAGLLLPATLAERLGLRELTDAHRYHPLLAVAAGSGEVLMARLREGRGHTARGAAHFLRETVGRVRAARASGPLTLRADSGFYSHAVVDACWAMDVRFSVTVRLQPQLRTCPGAGPGPVSSQPRSRVYGAPAPGLTPLRAPRSCPGLAPACPGTPRPHTLSAPVKLRSVDSGLEGLGGDFQSPRSEERVRRASGTPC